MKKFLFLIICILSLLFTYILAEDPSEAGYYDGYGHWQPGVEPTHDYSNLTPEDLGVKKPTTTSSIDVPIKVTTMPEVLGVKFGISQKTLKSKYKTSKPLVEETAGIAYASPLIKIRDVQSIFYQFYKNKLSKIMIVFDTSSIQPSAQGLLNTYYYYKEILIKKYGEPFKNVENMPSAYDTDQYRNTGLSSGQGEYNTVWKSDNLSIILRLSGDNYKISSLLLYTYDPLSDEEDKNKDQNAVDNM